ncbi:MAG: PAS domain S-box protein [Deinococcus sp.]|nr:PAS domain S-box protein [Deinococcus sp.]
MSRFSFASLRSRLLILALIALFPGAGLGLYLVAEQRRLAVATVEQDLLQLARQAAADQEQLITGVRQLLVSLAQLPEVGGSNAAACSGLMASLLRRNRLYADMGAAQPDGTIFCSAVPATRPRNVADQPHFRRAIETRDFAVGDYQVSQANGKPGLVFGYPALDDLGQVQAVLYAVLDLAWMNERAAQAQLPRNATLTVVDRKGIILARHPSPEQWVGQTLVVLPLLQAMLAGRGGGVVRAPDADQDQQVYALTPLSGAGQRDGLSVSISVPSAGAFAASNQRLRRNLSWLGLVLVGALIVAWKAGDVLVLHGIQPVVRAAQRLGAGDRQARAGLGGELSQLAQALEQLARSLEQAQEQHRQAEARYRTLVDSLPLGWYQAAPTGQLLEANPALVQMLGWPDQKALLPANLADFYLHPEEYWRWRAQLEREGVVRNAEVQLRRPDGSGFWVVGNGQVFRDASGRVLSYQGSFTDITVRKRAECEARSSNLRYQQLFDTAREGILLLDAETGQITDLNPILASMLGYSREELLGKPLWEIGLCEGREAWQGALQKWQQGESMHQKELSILDKKGQRVSIEVFSQLSVVDDTKIVQCHICNVTERNELRSALAREQALLRSVVDNSPDAIFIKDRESRFLLSNLAHVQVLGAAKPDEVIGKTDFDFLPLELAAQYYADEQLVIQSGQPLVNIEEILTDPGGTKRWLSTTKIPLRNGTGKVVGLVGISRDITEQKRLVEQLNQAEKKTADLPALSGREFNNLLTAILGYADLLLVDLGDGNPLRRKAEQIRKAADRVAVLVRQLGS